MREQGRCDGSSCCYYDAVKKGNLRYEYVSC